jgi:putative membrane protein
MAFPYSVKHHLRSEWGAVWASSGDGVSARPEHVGGICAFNPEYDSLLPAGLEGHEEDGLGLPLQLTFFVDSFLKRGVERGWFHAPGASQLQVQLNEMMDAYGKMETIRLTPIPVAHLYAFTISSHALPSLVENYTSDHL